jgi:DNA-binding HxlR family transcriptional regulator
MQHATFAAMDCPIALSLERVGEWWSIFILRDASLGRTRFDQFQKSLRIGPNILSRRLRGLVEAGLLTKSRYNEHPPRDQYRLTERGQEFRPVLWALPAWGNKHFVPEGQALTLMDAATGLPAEPAMVDANIGKRMDQAVFRSIRRLPSNADIRKQP